MPVAAKVSPFRVVLITTNGPEGRTIEVKAENIDSFATADRIARELYGLTQINDWSEGLHTSVEIWNAYGEQVGKSRPYVEP